ncbi:hypothetical protein PMAYCL1PPCAC_03595 [Pristionchus mayeri]|uniref:C2H2-type domain-containing protein n=1 Tax=Pristionchus mayeri TaxID=1317129 RepID=A0AAN4Z904_9BILA|nr:hypothetical protein PMAYCL1PPCAC_03595 [Pristionchus mayeri]
MPTTELLPVDTSSIDRATVGEGTTVVHETRGAVEADRIRRVQPKSYIYKSYKCKNCPHVSQSKEDWFGHTRTHIPAEKQLNCNKCGFVTEHKNQLEYHQRNHTYPKPFRCSQCAYTCVSSSLLDTHTKQHSNYATSYGHHSDTEDEAEAVGRLDISA